MEESVMETITKMSNLDNEKNFTIARIIERVTVESTFKFNHLTFNISISQSKNYE